MRITFSCVVVIAFLAIANAGLVAHDVDHGDHHKATSYQSIKFEHYHAVPTYVKKEDAHLLKHPISAGQTGAKLEVHHGGKHHHGYAIADQHSSVHHGHGGGDENESYGHQFEAQTYQEIPEHHQPVYTSAHEEEVPSHQEESNSQHETIDYHQLQAALAAQQKTKASYAQNSGLGLGHYH